MAEKEHTLFNGRRSADEYVKGYLKGVIWIVSGVLIIAIATSAFFGKKVLANELSITEIKANRYTRDDGFSLHQDVVNNKLVIVEIKTGIKSMASDLSEIKGLLRRAAPYEIQR